MDEADRAQVEIEHALIGQMASAREQSTVVATGKCLNCGQSLPRRMRWCDAGCRDDWARLSVQRRVN